MKQPLRWAALGWQLLAGYTVTTLVAVASILLLTLDYETVGLGLLLPLFLAPSLILFVASKALCRKGWVKHAAYLAPASAFLLFLVGCYVLARLWDVTDASGPLARLLALTFTPTAVVTYLFLRISEKKEEKRSHESPPNLAPRLR